MVMLSANSKRFFTPEWFARSQSRRMESTRGRLLLAGCGSASYLLQKVAERYDDFLTAAGSETRVQYLAEIDRRFSDTETTVRLDQPVSGCDVFLFQSLFNPIFDCSVDENYMAFLIAARTFRDHGANRITAVLPYLAYARQDKPTKFMREATTARLMADLSIEAGIDRLVTWDPHSSQLSGFYDRMPVDMLDPLTLFVETFCDLRDREDVIVVAPDAGASKFVTYFGRALGLRCAIASKYRPQAEEAVITEVIGDFSAKRTAIVLDDMISSGGTIYELITRLVRQKNIEQVYLGVSHNLCTPVAYERLLDLHLNYGLKQVIVTNSIPQTSRFLALPFISVTCLSEILVRTINRIHYNQSVSELFYKQAEAGCQP